MMCVRPPFPPQVEIADVFEAVAEDPVCAIKGQRKAVRDLQNGIESRVFFGAEEIESRFLATVSRLSCALDCCSFAGVIPRDNSRRCVKVSAI